MRKSEKLSDAIGEISDDIIEEAYTYKPKHDMHQRKASFKWGAAVAVLAMLVLAGVGQCEPAAKKTGNDWIDKFYFNTKRNRLSD